MGETLAYTICKKKTEYVPRMWFNSAKFLDIEYQVYGDVRPASRLPENHDQLYWEHTDGKKSIRIVYDRDSKKVLGFNLMGIRYRHEVCEKWIKGGTHIEKVLQNLSLANFDPEFYKTYESDILALYNEKAGTSLTSTGSKRPTDALKFIGVRSKRFDTTQETQLQSTSTTLITLLFLAVFITAIMAY